jgi:hypothetical protein
MVGGLHVKKREYIISAVKKCVLKKTHKFGIHIPKNLDEAHVLDKANGNTLWADAIAKEMKNVRVAFNILENDQAVPVGHPEIRCHGIYYDIKMDGFARKFQMVARGHMTETTCKSRQETFKMSPSQHQSRKNFGPDSGNNLGPTVERKL